ncbi:VTT domain-containing protein [Apilactobacillus apisilvae]|uniref:VTT domain-containing protein n=1 Tax=Apilactobacillus apisilvae TaxID=2923364 RepID=A0ABY4PID5_9LACO|nr:VTT domain-containing protein [Apilactobacillus apisilvae]UQS85221.1 VTT domain-containing protein [Apilactobacillus apisilvae]
MNTLIDFILHIDKHIINLVTYFGDWTYLLLFAVIFIETGIVIMPFLPGDSLLFAASAISANPQYHLNIWIFILIFLLASFLGDTLNFYLGDKIGYRITKMKLVAKVIKPKQLDQAKAFFDKYGILAIFIARFMPIIRTLAPFIAATSGYKYEKFIKYNLSACIVWVGLCCGAGYFFGNIPFVQEHFSIVVIGIILVTLIPGIVAFIKERRNK